MVFFMLTNILTESTDLICQGQGAVQLAAKAFLQFTLELEPESEYEVLIDGESAGKMNTNLSGKLSVSVELSADQSAAIKVVKC